MSFNDFDVKHDAASGGRRQRGGGGGDDAYGDLLRGQRDAQRMRIRAVKAMSLQNVIILAVAAIATMALDMLGTAMFVLTSFDEQAAAAQIGPDMARVIKILFLAGMFAATTGVQFFTNTMMARAGVNPPKAVVQGYIELFTGKYNKDVAHLQKLMGGWYFLIYIYPISHAIDIGTDMIFYSTVANGAIVLLSALLSAISEYAGSMAWLAWANYVNAQEFERDL